MGLIYTYFRSDIVCNGAGSGDYANITNIAMECGLIYGAARRKDGAASIIFEPESEWVQPIYSCASTTKALIRTVNFRFNGTVDLANLAIDSIKDKEYTRLDEQPIWAVENSK